MIDSAAEFVRLRQSEIPEEYGRAANEEACDAVWIEVISNHPEMREWVALNKAVPLSVLEVLARDPRSTVRRTVAMKRKLSHELFELLAKDPDETVRASVARNQKTPTDVLLQLCRDTVALVSSTARSRIGA
jgi:hypothetical protein